MTYKAVGPFNWRTPNSAPYDRVNQKKVYELSVAEHEHDMIECWRETLDGKMDIITGEFELSDRVTLSALSVVERDFLNLVNGLAHTDVPWAKPLVDEYMTKYCQAIGAREEPHDISLVQLEQERYQE